MHSSWVYSTTSISGYRVTSQKLIRGGKERENLPGVPVIYQVLPPKDLRPAEPKATRLRLLSPAAAPVRPRLHCADSGGLAAASAR